MSKSYKEYTRFSTLTIGAIAFYKKTDCGGEGVFVKINFWWEAKIFWVEI